MEALISCHVLHNILDARVGGENFVINRTCVSNPINHSGKIFRHKSEWYNLAFLVFYSLIQEFLNKSLVTERRIIDPTRSQIVPMVSEDNISIKLLVTREPLICIRVGFVFILSRLCSTSRSRRSFPSGLLGSILFRFRSLVIVTVGY